MVRAVVQHVYWLTGAFGQARVQVVCTAFRPDLVIFSRSVFGARVDFSCLPLQICKRIQSEINSNGLCQTKYTERLPWIRF